MKLISWNIDSINAALTGTSTRAEETRSVLHKIADRHPDVIAIQETKLSKNGPTKKHLAVLAELFPDYQVAWRSSVEPARKGYAGTMYLYLKKYEPTITYPQIGAPETMDDEGRIITLEFPDFFVTEVYTPNSGSGLKRLADRQVCLDGITEMPAGFEGVQSWPALARRLLERGLGEETVGNIFWNNAIGVMECAVCDHAK